MGKPQVKYVPALKSPVFRLFNQIESVLIYLYERWQDEHDYEDLSEYVKPLLPYLDKAGATEVKMTQRPFGFTCVIGGRRFRFSINRSSYAYKEIR